MYFADRSDAGRRLAEPLRHLRGDVVVLGLPRGGVVVAAEVAAALDAPLDVIVVRKLGVPSQPELAMGAIGEDGVRVVNRHTVWSTEAELAGVERHERAELDRRARRYRDAVGRVDLAGRTVVVVDDGIATGATARAACTIARQHGAARVVLAVPVAPPGWTDRLAGDADELVCLHTPEDFLGIGQFYGAFSQTSDEEVIDCLRRAAERAGATTGDGPGASTGSSHGGARPMECEVAISVGPARLTGQLTVPPKAGAVVVFAHGSGSGRHSPRNRAVAAALNRAGLATLLFDLLTPDEERDRDNVFDTGLLADRLTGATRWLVDRPEVADLPVGYFGASTGAAAALVAAASPAAGIGAVVSRGGRPDLAEPRLPEVTAPTLLIVGDLDGLVIDLNRRAQESLHCENRLAVVPGATHLFEEPGTLDRVAGLAADWFTGHLTGSRHAGVH